MEEPKVTVGILSDKQVDFVLLSYYLIDGRQVSGQQTAICQEGEIVWNGRAYTELLFLPANEADAVFELSNVTIGIGFHWERKENQRFRGALRVIVEGNKLTCINVIGVEEYLTSVISSEMSATASCELLKAHAVISRSWLLANIINGNEDVARCSDDSPKNADEYIRWYERDAHTNFDVCADDHCQRYQGITRASTTAVQQAIEETRGELLMWAGKVCDARFSKCCGGALEEFQYCWDNVKHPYLSTRRDSIEPDISPLPNLSLHHEAEKWIGTSPSSFCNTNNKQILAQVLNNYDQETSDFYRWRVEYTQEELSRLIRERSGVDYGEIVDLTPIARGTSARIWKLKIVGTKQTLTIGKELEIRRTLSKSHLYSSAFVVDRLDVSEQGIPQRWVISGAGWGHGVGLCQIGAAVMGENGYAYKDILLHYYKPATIEKLYNLKSATQFIRIKPRFASVSRLFIQHQPPHFSCFILYFGCRRLQHPLSPKRVIIKSPQKRQFKFAISRGNPFWSRC